MIKLENISRKFDHRSIAGVHSISLEVDKGQILSILGPNGSGKSTLLKIIAGQIQQDSGSFTSLGKVQLFELKDELSDVNVQKFLISKVSQTDDEDKKIQLTRDLADVFEFTFQLRQSMGQLSQGQRQKILMASELINHPEVLLLDEPFNHLDPFTRKEILSSLFRYIKLKELTVIWVTHDRNEAFRLADKIAILNFGKFEQVSSARDIVFKPKNLFVAQFAGHENFLPVRRKDSENWNTPWGDYKLKSISEKEEALLVIPPYAWKKDDSSIVDARILNRFVQNLQWELEIEWDSRRFIVNFPPSIGESLSSLTTIRLSPIWEECFLVPL